MRFRRFFYIGAIFLLVLVKFTIDVVIKNVAMEGGGLVFIRELAGLAAFGLIWLVIDGVMARRVQNPMKILGILLVAGLILLVLSLILTVGYGEGFDAKNLALIPLDYPTLFVASLMGLLFGGFAVLTVRLLKELIVAIRGPIAARNYFVMLGLIVAGAFSTITLRPLASSGLTTTFLVASIVAIVVNSFRLPWIIYLTKREKIVALIYSMLLFGGFLFFNVFTHEQGTIQRSLLYYSYPVRQFVNLALILGSVYFGIAFVSTLFHLPTAEAFDRKRSEVTSLHSLSRLIAQAFDFNELADTVTTMTLQVCQAKSSWLEIIQPREEAVAPPPDAAPDALIHRMQGHKIQLVGMKNITREEVEELVPPMTQNLRDEVMASGKPIVVDDLARDERFKHWAKGKGPAGSIVVTPLLSHAGIVGVLYATKESTYGFLRDDVDVLGAFADQVTVAIENSRLIRESLERERLIREMMLAQEMQRKLLPQTLPVYATFEMDAVSTPAFEVGGDYYDVIQLDAQHVGVVVGDVSGKGLTAAFYMSEVKGIFQALGPMYFSPRQFLAKANEALVGSLDRHSFISLIYAVLNVETGLLTLARAGHCPMLFLGKENVEYVRPGGIGMGLTRGSVFEDAIEERSIQLLPGDVCLFYTDGITEARCGDDEFGYERLRDTALQHKYLPASQLKDEILGTVKTFVEQQANEDDLTLVILKWRG